MVAGPKIRIVENGYDLDLTYVTDRVIAMAFPAEGLEKLYRNSINDVDVFKLRFLNILHKSMVAIICSITSVVENMIMKNLIIKLRSSIGKTIKLQLCLQYLKYVNR
jgi:hypothetical protein